MSVYNLKNKIQKDKAIEKFKFFLDKEYLINLTKKSQKRTTVQNSALWLYFTQCADALNDLGYYNTISPIIGEPFELSWNKDSFHDKIWIPLQYTAYNTSSTKDLDTKQIDPIYDTICKWMCNLGVHVNFPNQFDYYLKMFEK